SLAQNSMNKVIRIAPNSSDISVRSTDNTVNYPLLLQSAGGFLGVARTSASHPIHVGTGGTDGNGAHLTVGGVWTNGSSRTFKDNIQDLSADEAKAAVAALKPVTYTYKNDTEPYVGFIAEDVPQLVAQEYDRHYLSSMDIVATLTKVVQEQQKTIDELSKKVNELEQK
ncbi:MAG: tail fiber domain-containing protein, partial [Thermoanaerobaculia bacterium]